MDIFPCTHCVAAIDACFDEEDKFRSLLDADLLSVLKLSGTGLTPLEPFKLRLPCRQPSATRILLEQKQDEAVRLVRDTIQAEALGCGMPDLVVSIDSYLFLKLISRLSRSL
jgi:hypothetical protein